MALVEVTVAGVVALPAARPCHQPGGAICGGGIYSAGLVFALIVLGALPIQLLLWRYGDKPFELVAVDDTGIRLEGRGLKRRLRWAFVWSQIVPARDPIRDGQLFLTVVLPRSGARRTIRFSPDDTEKILNNLRLGVWNLGLLSSHP